LTLRRRSNDPQKQINGTPLLRQWQTMSSSSQLFSNYDDDDILDDLMGNDDTTSGSGGMYTQGGVIMPEGGANPCVIKVRL